MQKKIRIEYKMLNKPLKHNFAKEKCIWILYFKDKSKDIEPSNNM